MKVFISYRRDGGEDRARLLYDNLKNKGLDVFYDLESLKPGTYDTKIITKIKYKKNYYI